MTSYSEHLVQKNKVPSSLLHLLSKYFLAFLQKEKASPASKLEPMSIPKVVPTPGIYFKISSTFYKNNKTLAFFIISLITLKKSPS